MKHPLSKNKSMYERLLTGMPVCEQTLSAPRSPKEKSNISLKSFSLSQEGSLHRLGIDSSLTFTQGTEANREDMLWHSSSFVFIAPPTLCNQNIHKERRGGCWLFPFPGQKRATSKCGTPRSFLRSKLPAVPPLPAQWTVPTTRWRKVFCSGNSVCRTHCWLSEVLGLFQLLPGASGPAAGVFYRPSGLGTGSGSWDEKEKEQAEQ